MKTLAKLAAHLSPKPLATAFIPMAPNTKGLCTLTSGTVSASSQRANGATAGPSSMGSEKVLERWNTNVGAGTGEIGTLIRSMGKAMNSGRISARTEGSTRRDNAMGKAFFSGHQEPCIRAGGNKDFDTAKASLKALME